jgi:hypothetical protein
MILSTRRNTVHLKAHNPRYRTGRSGTLYADSRVRQVIAILTRDVTREKKSGNLTRISCGVLDRYHQGDIIMITAKQPALNFSGSNKLRMPQFAAWPVSALCARILRCVVRRDIQPTTSFGLQSRLRVPFLGPGLYRVLPGAHEHPGGAVSHSGRRKTMEDTF